MTREEMMELTAPELLPIYNKLYKTNVLRWAKKKSDLVDLILAKQPAPKPKKAPASERTIRIAALELLCKAAFYEDKTRPPSPDNVVDATHKNARSVGLPYLEIIDLIKVEFPDAETSAACLRWYAVKVRASEFGYEDFTLAQRRPRARPSK